MRFLFGVNHTYHVLGYKRWRTVESNLEARSGRHEIIVVVTWNAVLGGMQMPPVLFNLSFKERDCVCSVTILNIISSLYQ